MTSALALTLVGLAFCGAFVSSLVGAGGAPLGGHVSRRVPLTGLRVVLAAIITVVMLRVWLDVATR